MALPQNAIHRIPWRGANKANATRIRPENLSPVGAEIRQERRKIKHHVERIGGYWAKKLDRG